MKIAIEGCAHGELERIYESVQYIEKQDGTKVDLLICCGDFQATRNAQDLSCMAVSQKYRNICSFYKYYSGEKVAPVLTLFIGGNHEASNHMQELPYGGWAAPNIYYLGYAGVVNFGGVRIGGLSGIYKGRDYMRGHYEKPPYNEESKRSVYHVRNLEVFRLKQLSQPIDIMLSHDWPRGITDYGDTNTLLRKKPFLRKDIEENMLGSKPAEELLHELRPAYWFAAHLHCKYPAVVSHGPRKGVTKFLALDKCLPRRKFLQIVDIEHDESNPLELSYDLEWLTIINLTNHLLSVKKGLIYMPGPSEMERWIFIPTEEEMKFVLKRFGGDLKVPQNFCRTVTPWSPDSSECGQPKVQLNPQTTLFCELLGVDDPLALLMGSCIEENTPTSFSLPSFITPERPGDTSQISFTGDEDSPLDSSLEISRLTQSSSSSPYKRLSMSLPPPKSVLPGDDSDDFLPLTQESNSLLMIDDTVTSTSSCVGDSVISTSSCVGDSVISTNSCVGDSVTSTNSCAGNSMSSENQLSESVAASESQISDSMSQAEESAPLWPSKKFKRRNQALYTSTDDE